MIVDIATLSTAGASSMWLTVGWGVSVLMLVVGYAIGVLYYDTDETPPDVDASPERRTKL